MTATLLILGGMLMMMAPFYEAMPVYQRSLRLVGVVLTSAIPFSNDPPPELIKLLEEIK